MDRTSRKPPRSEPDAPTRADDPPAGQSEAAGRPEDPAARRAGDTSRPSDLPTTTVSPITEEPGGPITVGRILGDRYRIEAFLGRGGMGEVWRAADLKLRVEVALKAMKPDRLASAAARELLRREVRSARDVWSPNVCRIFDLVVEDNQEMVSMEYIDGTTLLDVLRRRGPLELREANEIASQFLAGLEAIHKANLVHRDVKPENIMITRSGRVVLMDFGLAKPRVEDETATLAGTPAYMAPELLRGAKPDARTDIFSAGVVLAEMIHAKGLREHESRETLQKELHGDPPEVPESPWREVVLRAVAKDPGKRYASAQALVRALEEVTQRAAGDEDVQPYPGLASFTEAEVEYFFGREQEVEEMWKKMQRPQLHALIGPSGAGKSSFLQAGLIPARPEGWRILVCHPGNAPFAELAEQLGPELAGDREAVRQLVRFEDPDVAVSLARRWRDRHQAALVIVDQFEELFTLNPAEVQGRFATLLGRLPLEADVHVLLSMRDDFLYYCNAHSSLGPIKADLTILSPPTGANLRRALVQPALVCGYRFEDDSLTGEMLAEVEGERGALPMLAFAVSRLWEKRDREAGHLTRKAYEAIGGVSGALAQHAEATLERIGSGRHEIVRDIFRNLVTAQGTRAAREWDELLSVFEDRTVAEEVLRALIDARLLTSFEMRGGEGKEEPGRRVEIVHESLLSAWPRLVRWRTQDADSAELRDQLRQAARMWEERDRSDDLLWSGSMYLEYQLWRERYPGGLTATEEEFTRAMTGRARRRRRRRRIAVAGVIVVLLAVLGVVSALYRESVVAKRRTVEAARRSEAARIFFVAQQVPEGDGAWRIAQARTDQLAYALASLENADDPRVRRWALEAISQGPTVLALAPKAGWNNINSVAFSPDGRWLAASDQYRIRLWSPTDRNFRTEMGTGAWWVRFGSESDRLVTFRGTRKEQPGSVSVWSVPGGEEIHTISFDTRTIAFAQPTMGREIVLLRTNAVPGDSMETYTGDYVFESWPLEGGDPTTLGRLPAGGGIGMQQGRRGPFWQWGVFAVDPSATRLAYAKGHELYLTSFDAMLSVPPQLLSRHDRPIWAVTFHPDGERLAFAGQEGEIRILSLEREQATPVRVLRGDQKPTILRFDPGGNWLFVHVRPGYMQVWDLAGPQDAAPMTLGQWDASIDPGGRWIASTHHKPDPAAGATLWPLAHDYPYHFPGHTESIESLAFAPDSSWLASGDQEGVVRILPLTPASGQGSRILFQGKGQIVGLEVDPDGRNLLVRSSEGGGWAGILSLDDGRLRVFGETLEDYREQEQGDRNWQNSQATFDHSGRLVAEGGTLKDEETEEERVIIRVWDLDSGKYRVLDPEDNLRIRGLRFLPDGGLLSTSFHVDYYGPGGLRLWNLRTGKYEQLPTFLCWDFELNPDGKSVWFAATVFQNQFEGHMLVYDLETRETRLRERGAGFGPIDDLTFDPTGKILVMSHGDSWVSVGPVAGGDRHLLLGQRISTVAVSPDGRWIAIGRHDGDLSLWPMPKGVPFHTLPYDEFVDRLRALTNRRVIADPDQASGYACDWGPFHGWETVPTW